MDGEGKLLGAIRAGGKVIITASIDDMGNEEVIDSLLREPKVTISIEKIRKKRSLNANAYLWQICHQIAVKIKTDKISVYEDLIRKYGSFIDCAVIEKALPILEQTYRCIEILERGEMNGLPAVSVRCYRGSSTYDKDEMSWLIDGAVSEAKDLGIETMTPDEIAHMVSTWKGAFNE